MRHFILLDYECVQIYISSVIEGCETSQFTGKKPWECVQPEIREELEKHQTKVLIAKEGMHSWGVAWKWENESRFFFTECAWVGLTDVAMVNVVWEFPYELTTLTKHERMIVDQLGGSEKVESVAHNTGLTINTIHSHLRNIRKKLHMDSINQLIAFAGVYRSAVTSSMTSDGSGQMPLISSD